MFLDIVVEYYYNIERQATADIALKELLKENPSSFEIFKSNSLIWEPNKHTPKFPIVL